MKSKKFLSALLCVVLLSFLFSCSKTEKGEGSLVIVESSAISETTSIEESTEVSDILDKSKSYSVLFIGNSYTYFNDLPSLFKYVAVSGGYVVEVDSVTSGGYTLERFATSDDPLGEQVAQKLESTKYDFVFLQEQSSRPAKHPQKFFNACKTLCKKITDTGASVIFYETWGWKDGTPDITDAGWTTEQMEMKLYASYKAIGEKLGCKVSYAGLAMLDLYKNHKEINLYNADGSHPSPAGSYLAALTHFATLTGESPFNVKYRLTDVTVPDANLIRQAAYDAVFNTPELPSEYNITVD